MPASPVSGLLTTIPNQMRIDQHMEASPPRLRPGVTLVGPLEGSGYQTDQWLIQRDGRYILVSELLYRLAEACDGRRSTSDIASVLTASTEWLVTREDVDRLLDRLAPMGLVDSANGQETQPIVSDRMHRSALQVNLRTPILGPTAIDRIARRLRFLFLPPIVAAALAGVAFIHVWLYVLHGPTSSFEMVVARPGLFLLIFAGIVAAAAFHEFGHAAALRYGGGRAGRMGFGFYLALPAFYTDVSEGYRLPRRDRIRTDLGGPYFHLLLMLPIAGLHAATGQEFWNLLIVLIDVEVVRQLLPLGRLDGYWLLADLTGIPDPLSHLGVLLRRVRPGRDLASSRTPTLRPGIRRILVGYFGVVLVLIPAMVFFGITRAPRLVELAWMSILVRSRELAASISHLQLLPSLAGTVELLLLGLQVFGIGFVVYLLAWRPAFRLWNAADAQAVPVRRIVRSALLVAVGGALLGISTLLPWITVGALLPGARAGYTQPIGWLALLLGLGILAAVPSTVLARRITLRRGMALVVLALALLASAVAVGDILRIRRLVHSTLEATSIEMTGNPPADSETLAAEDTLAELGVTLSPGLGVWVAAVGGAIAGGGAMMSFLVPAGGVRRREDGA